MHELREGNNCADIFARIDSSRPNIDQDTKIKQLRVRNQMHHQQYSKQRETEPFSRLIWFLTGRLEKGIKLGKDKPSGNRRKTQTEPNPLKPSPWTPKKKQCVSRSIINIKS
ncbi:hypothetical protein Peur_033756 [Populus x canadensis]